MIHIRDFRGQPAILPFGKFGEGFFVRNVDGACPDTGLLRCDVQILTPYNDKQTGARINRPSRTKSMLLSPELDPESFPGGRFRVIYDRQIFGDIEKRVVLFAIAFNKLHPEYNPNTYLDWVERHTQVQEFLSRRTEVPQEVFAV